MSAPLKMRVFATIVLDEVRTVHLEVCAEVVTCPMILQVGDQVGMTSY
jgi:hypothetical protein